jgi:diguanylate cyclase (GGDEF)-like protein/PAS domain S-box-containing protein
VLAGSADLAAELLDHLDDAVWVLAADGTVIDYNPAAARLLGAQGCDLAGGSIRELVDPPLTAEGWHLLLERLGGPDPVEVPVRLRRTGGASVAVRLTVLRHRSLRHDAVLAVARRDCAGVHLADGSTRSAVGLADLLEATGDGLAVVDADGCIELVNHAFSALVDRSPELLIGRSVYDPPWVLLDESGVPVPAERSPAVVALRSGTEAIGPMQCVERRHGGPAWFRMRARPTTTPAGPRGLVVALLDCTELRRSTEAARLLVDRDPLTGLASRSHISDLLTAAVAEAGTSGGGHRLVGVLHVNLDNFRTVNDTFGTPAGDAVLAEAATRLRDLGERRVEVGRLGVDEFLVVVCGDGASLAFDARLRRLAEEVQRRLRAPFQLEGLEIRLGASVGVARLPGDATDVAELTSAADRALSAGRAEGPGRIRFYEPAIDERTRTGLRLDRDLRLAAARRELDVHYQPILDLRTGAVAAAEALVRWHHPEQGPIPPSVFIPSAEATGAIGAISDLVLTTVAEDLAAWSVEDLLPADARIAVNVSPAEFEQAHFTERLAAALDAAGVPPDRLELEITESLLVQDLAGAAARLEELDELGFLIALDDFGTGYSSLSYLHSLPLHTLKIDRRFVGDVGDGRSGTITRAILTLAHNLGIVAVAEGVETERQREFLATAGCDLVQGFLFAPPLPRPAFEQFLRERRRQPPAALGAVS